MLKLMGPLPKAFASSIAARKVQSPFRSAHRPSPGEASGLSAVVVTTKGPAPAAVVSPANKQKSATKMRLGKVGIFDLRVNVGDRVRRPSNRRFGFSLRSAENALK